jgi:hypothetical protein
VKIIKGTEAIPVEHPVFLIFGQPGICKSSLGYSAKNPLLLDFDKGAHRAANRKDSLVIDTWEDVTELTRNVDQLKAYDAIVVDTVGRCLDVMTADIALNDPKKAPGGNLSQQGWGVLKNRFRTWTSQLRALGKDVLLIAHDKEDKDGDTRIVRPDIVGGSYSEVMKIADFVGYVYMNGRDRLLDFNPTDRWVGKNPAGWAPLKVPSVAKAQGVMADLFDKGREALGQISEESSRATQQVDEWRTTINGYTTVQQFNTAIPEIKKLNPLLQAQIAKLLMDAAEGREIVFDKAKKRFVSPVQEEAASSVLS